MLVKFFQTGCCKTHFVRGVPSEWGGGGGGGGGGLQATRILLDHQHITISQNEQ